LYFSGDGILKSAFVSIGIIGEGNFASTQHCRCGTIPDVGLPVLEMIFLEEVKE
jgi:hypothetical protein